VVVVETHGSLSCSVK